MLIFYINHKNTEKMFKTRINTFTQEPEAYGPAVLKTVSAETRQITNTKDGIDKDYHVATAEVTYADGSKEIVGSSVWAKSITSNPDFFKVGNTVELVVQTEGEYAGWSKCSMPTLAKVDITKLGLVAAPVQKQVPKVEA